MTNEQYLRLRVELIPAAEAEANAACPPTQPGVTTYQERARLYAARTAKWNRTYHGAMQRLAFERGLIRYDPRQQEPRPLSVMVLDDGGGL